MYLNNTKHRIETVHQLFETILEAVLFHNRNNFNSAIMVYVTNMKEHENIKILLRKIQYDKYKWT